MDSTQVVIMQGNWVWKEHLIRQGQGVSMYSWSRDMKKGLAPPSLHDNDLDPPFSPQYIDTDILRVTFE